MSQQNFIRFERLSYDDCLKRPDTRQGEMNKLETSRAAVTLSWRTSTLLSAPTSANSHKAGLGNGAHYERRKLLPEKFGRAF